MEQRIHALVETYRVRILIVIGLGASEEPERYY